MLGPCRAISLFTTIRAVSAFTTIQTQKHSTHRLFATSSPQSTIRLYDLVNLHQTSKQPKSLVILDVRTVQEIEFVRPSLPKENPFISVISLPAFVNGNAVAPSEFEDVLTAKFTFEDFQSTQFAVLCKAGIRSAHAIHRLEQSMAQFDPHFFNVEGGMDDWTYNGFPIEGEGVREQNVDDLNI